MKQGQMEKVLVSLLFLPLCIAGSGIGRAQRASDEAGSDMHSMPGDSPNSNAKSNSVGVFNYGAAALAAKSETDQSNQQRSVDAESMQRAAARGAWNAGVSNVGEANSGEWSNEASGFRAVGGSSWVAGKSSFGLERQRGGIWRAALPFGPSIATKEASARAAVPSTPSFAPSFPPFHVGLTGKAATPSLAKGFTSPFASRKSIGFGSGGVTAGGFGGQSGSGVKHGAFGSHAKGFGGFGSGARTTSKQHSNPSDSIALPALSGPLNLDEGSRGQIGGTAQGDGDNSH